MKEVEFLYVEWVKLFFKLVGKDESVSLKNQMTLTRKVSLRILLSD
jgi:hypothetical protein